MVATMKRREKALFGEVQLWFRFENRVEPGAMVAATVVTEMRSKRGDNKREIGDEKDRSPIFPQCL